jgi:hypothetical protein
LYSSAVFQAGGLVVVLVEVSRKAYLASIVPVIVNAILNEHQIIVDIVAFVGRGDFPRSRLGEKQRGKILAGWVSRKMRTIAQFSIKGGDVIGLPGSGGGSAAAPPPGTASSVVDSPLIGGQSDAPLAYEGGGLNRGSLGSFRSIGVAGAGSSLRNVEHAPQILEQRELEQQLEGMAALGGGTASYGYQALPQPLDTPLAEMPADEAPLGSGDAAGDLDRDGETPTKARHERQRSRASYEVPDFGSFGGGAAEDQEDRHPPRVGAKPGSRESGGGYRNSAQSATMRLPGVDGRESLSFDDWPIQQQHQQQQQQHVDNRNSLPSRQHHGPSHGGYHSGGVVAEDEDDDEWAKDAGMYMNLAGTLGRRDV